MLVAAVVALPVPALAAPEDDLEAAQRRANEAAAELADAREEMAHAEDAVAQSHTRVERVEARLAVVRDQVRQLAVHQYVQGTGPLARLLRMPDANQLVRAQQFASVLAGTSTDSLRQYRVDREDLRQELSALERTQESRAEAVENLRRRQAEIVAELERLSAVVEQARIAEERERQAQLAAAARSNVGPPPLGQQTLVPTSPRTAPPPAADDAPADDAPVAPDAAPQPTAATGAWICPVQGPRAFSNDYGAPRGGGYSHLGNDILAPRGTPVVASVDGFVTHRSGAVSGLAYYLDGDDGTEYFGAHLDSFGANGRVSAGTIVGTVGNTGDAAGGPPHLHFEMHPGGRGNINPYPTLSRYC
jgi:murein DD-endopeptidase MepM/ murein hydrolase activator NlpD